MNNTDIKNMVQAVMPLDPAKAQLSRGYFYASLPLAMADAVFSIGVKYTQTENAVQHLAKKMGWPVHRPLNSPFLPKNQQQTVQQLIAAYFGTNDPAKDLYANRGFANPKARDRIPKALLVLELARVFEKRGIQVFQDLQAYPSSEALDEAINLLPSLSSGIVVRYLRMLAGDDSQVKPDRHIAGFVKRALGRSVTDPVELVALVRATASALKKAGCKDITPRALDHLIWNHQRNVGSGALGAVFKKTALTSATTITLPKRERDSSPQGESLLYGLITFDPFWAFCRFGGDIKSSLIYGVDEDERLWIKSKKSERHETSGACYRIKRSTVRNYLEALNDLKRTGDSHGLRKFRANHGWFYKLLTHFQSGQAQLRSP